MQPPRGPAPSEPSDAEAVTALAELCARASDAPTESQALRTGLEVLEGLLGGQVALDLRDPAPSEDDDVADRGPHRSRAPLLAAGRPLGEVRATGVAVDPVVAAPFLEVAGWILGSIVAGHRARSDRATGGASRAEVDGRHVHELRAHVATIGVAASVLRARGGALDEQARDRLLQDVESSVAQLTGLIDDIVAGPHGAPR